MTHETITTMVRYHIREATAGVWTATEITDHINIAQRYVASQLHPSYLPELKQSDTGTAATGTANYDLAVDFIQLGSDVVSLNSLLYSVVSLDEALEVQNYDSNHIYYEKKIAWVQDNDLYLFPTPTATENTKTITWFYIQHPVDISGGDECPINDSVVDLVILKAAADALIKIGDFEKIQSLDALLNRRIDELNKRVAA